LNAISAPAYPEHIGAWKWEEGVMRAATVFLLVLTLVPLGATAQSSASLASIHRIYVDSMGQSDEAVRFRALLGEEFGKAGFTVADTPANADARLTGSLSLKIIKRGRTHAYVTVALNTPEGEQVWGGEFHEPFFRVTLSNDAVAVRARDIVKKFKTDQERSLPR
jgi:hypothetical protein